MVLTVNTSKTEQDKCFKLQQQHTQVHKNSKKTTHNTRNPGGGTEARPGTEKRCSHNLQSGPVKTWTAVCVIINISDRRSTYLK